ncbi:FAD-binding oxidoreductase [Micromonospora sp. CPCC 206060]|uniref:FAD-binding oxidoreductase n=1 Tax=Micromonospora sp. CPCC 206060 TaxID=3122406 RepID=UPI002FF435B2
MGRSSGSTHRPEVAEVTRQLADICGTPFARPAGAADEVAGVPARWVAAPGGVHAAARVLRLAAERDLSVVPRGAGTKIDWGNAPSRVDILLDTGRLAGVRHDSRGSGSAEVGAGTPLRAAQAILGRTGQRLALDAPSDGATVGGVLAADEPGPLRHRHGPPCDQLVALSYLDADGELVRVGGGPPAPGPDRLLCGSQGGLGVLVSAAFRVQPIPAGRVWVSRSVWSPLEVHELVRTVVAAPLQPAAIEVDLPAVPVDPRRWQRAGNSAPPPAGRLVVLLEGGPAEVTERAVRAVDLLGGDARAVHRAPEWWRRYPFREGDIALRVEVPTSNLHAAVYALRDAAGAPVPVRGSAGLGTVHAVLPGSTPPDRVAAILDAVRTVLLARRGRCTVVSAPPAVRSAVDLWGQPFPTGDLLAAKERYDPRRRLAPGRLPGGC